MGGGGELGSQLGPHRAPWWCLGSRNGEGRARWGGSLRAQGGHGGVPGLDPLPWNPSVTPERCGVGTGWAPASGAAKKPWGRGWGHPQDGDKRGMGERCHLHLQWHLTTRATSPCSLPPPSLPGRLPCTIHHPDLHDWFPPCCPRVPTSLGLPGWVQWENSPGPPRRHIWGLAPAPS